MAEVSDTGRKDRMLPSDDGSELREALQLIVAKLRGALALDRIHIEWIRDVATAALQPGEPTTSPEDEEHAERLIAIPLLTSREWESLRAALYAAACTAQAVGSASTGMLHMENVPEPFCAAYRKVLAAS